MTSGRPRLASTNLLRWWLVGLLLLCLVAPGCNGCTPIDPVEQAKEKKKRDDEEKKKKLEKPKPDFEAANLIIEPGEGKAASYDVKPGHWTTAAQAFKANNADVPAGDFYSASVDNQGRPLEIEDTPFRLQMSRPASLPKGQTKHFEFLYYIPRRIENRQNVIQLQNSLYTRGGGRELYKPAPASVTRMPAHQYHLLVLANDPDRYAYLKRLESVNTKTSEDDDRPSVQYYRVSLPKLEKQVPLPTHPLAWSSIAYIFWDDLDPSQLKPEQQQGLVDWLHWGGQLVVSGPESLDTLRGSFLNDLLPAEKVAAKPLEQAAFNAMNEHWSLKDRKKVVRTLDVVADKPPIGVELKLTEGAQFMPFTGEMVAERSVGRGRIAVTAFSLTGRTFINWPCLDNFVNGALLRRPARAFSPSEFDGAKVAWQDEHYRIDDPRLVTKLRYFSRDVGSTVTRAAPNAIQPPVELTAFDGYTYDAQSGVAGWNDFNGAANAARESLTQAAGISIPKAEFVMRVLGVYLLVLVPLNWGFFRLIGRVEWAWIAAPVIALVGAGVVVRMAQLDIGFARSHNEINIIEAYAGHDRAHVTRYEALYSSLSTNYDFHFDDPSALAQPFPTKRRDTTIFTRTEPSTCYFRRDQGVTLSNFVVRSNTTDFVHCEQMLPLGGAFALHGDDEKGWELSNQSDLTLNSAVILLATGNATRAAYIEKLGPKRTVSLTWLDSRESFNKLQDSIRPAEGGGTSISVSQLISLANDKLPLEKGAARLVGWTDQTIPGLTIEPQSPQTTSRSLVIVHLQPGKLLPPTSDANLRIAVIDDDQEKAEAERAAAEAAAASAPPGAAPPPTAPIVPPTSTISP